MECEPFSPHLLPEAWPIPPAAASAPSPLQPHPGPLALDTSVKVPVWPPLCDCPHSVPLIDLVCKWSSQSQYELRWKIHLKFCCCLHSRVDVEFNPIDFY